MGRGALPRVPERARAERDLRADVDGAPLRRADVNRRVPVEAELLLLVMRERRDVAILVRLAIDARDPATLILRVQVIRVSRVDEHPEAVPAVHGFPLVGRD